MTGLETLAFLLGTTGPIEQAIHIAQWLITHVRNFKQNAKTIKDITNLLEENRGQLQQLQIQIKKCQPHLSVQGLQTFSRIMSQVEKKLQAAFQSLQERKRIASKKGLHHFFKATSTAKSCEETQQLLQGAKESLVQLNSPIAGIEAIISITDTQTKEIEKFFTLLHKRIDQSIAQNESASPNDIFQPHFHLWKNTHTAGSNFRTANHSNRIAVQAKIKQQLLTATEGSHAIITIQGEAGIGKTTTLHFLSCEDTIKTHFIDGIYYMKLGADVSNDTDIVSNQLRDIVRISGGARLSAENDNWTSVTRAIEETSQWLKDKIFLLLIDDIWDTPGVEKILQDIVSQMILRNPRAAAVLTMRNQQVVENGFTTKVFELRRNHSTGQESREIQSRLTQHPENSMLEDKDGDTTRDIQQGSIGLHLLELKSKREEMKHAVSRPKWIESQLVSKGFILYEKELLLAINQGKNENHDCDDCDMTNIALRQILSATKLSVSYILNNPREVWFQLYARLMSTQDSFCLNDYLQGIEDNAPRPWLKPLTRSLTSVNGGTQDLVYVKEGIECMAVGPGKYDVVCGCENGFIVVVDIEASAITRKWKAHRGEVKAICVSPGGHFIASGSFDKTVKLWDCESWAQIGKTISGHSARICSVAVSGDERKVYFGCRDGTVWSYDVDTCSEDKIFSPVSRTFNFIPYRLGVLENGNLIVGYKLNNVSRVMKILLPQSTESERLKPSCNQAKNGNETPSEPKFNCDFEVTTLRDNWLVGLSGDRIKLILMDENRNLNIWNGMDMTKIGTIEANTNWVDHATVSNNGQRIAISTSSHVATYEESRGDEKGRYQRMDTLYIESSNNSLVGPRFIGDGDEVVFGTSEQCLRVLTFGKQPSDEEQRTRSITNVCTMTHTDGEYFLTGHGDGHIRFWNTNSGKQSGTSLSAHQLFVDKIKASENGEWIVSLSHDDVRAESVGVWNAHSRSLKRMLKVQTASRVQITGLDINCTGTRIAVEDQSGRIQLLDISNNETLLVIPPHKRTSRQRHGDMWFHTDSDCIISMSNEWIEEWDASTGSCVNSDKNPTSQLPMSREEMINALRNSKSQDMSEPDRLFSYSNEIRYGRKGSYDTLATMESRIRRSTYCSKSKALCVLLDSGLSFFRLYQ